MKRIRVIFMAALVFSTTAISPSAFCQESYSDAEKLFDARYDYDIYFSSGEDQVSILQSVEIIRFEEIAGRAFLVVRTSGFNAKDQEGFILFDAVTAILPDRNFKVQNKSSFVYK